MAQMSLLAIAVKMMEFSRIVELTLKLNGYNNIFIDRSSINIGDYFNKRILDSAYSLMRHFLLISHS